MEQTLSAAAHSELVIKKSRFIACVEPIASRALAVERVASLKQRHPSAAHVCWALMAGGQSAANDDGEPSGTAGRPMLDVMRHQALVGCLATVVRYYGGIKLGAGGLVRAYTDAVAQALLSAKASSQLVPVTRQVQRICSLPYALEGWARREIEQHQAQLLEVAHGSVVTLTLLIPESELATFEQRLNNGGQGRLVWHSTVHNVG